MDKRKTVIAKAALAIGLFPILLWAYQYGPDPGYCGVPNENGGTAGATCATAGCHIGTANNPANKGSVTVSFPNGLAYTPGVAQTLKVIIADPATTQKAAGFELTARLASTPSSMAGSFAATDVNTQLLCSQPDLQVFEQFANTAAQSCPSSFTLQYIEQSLSGYNNSVAQGLPYSYSFTWTPPATNIGNIVIYVAADAGVGNNPSADGDHVYSTTYTLTPGAGGTGTAPAISSGGVVNGASFQAGIVPNSWVTIQGTNLATVTDTWSNSIVNGALPTKLDGVTVSVGGQLAYVDYVSPAQLNVLAPNVGPGSMQVVVANANGTSSAVTATAQTFQPAFFLWPGSYAVATRQDYTYAVANGTFPTLTTTPAKPGDILILWGTGFGPTSPAAPVGIQAPSTQTYSTSNPVSVTIGGNAATVYGAALAPGFAGLYQVAIQVPSSIANGDYPIVATVNGVASPGSVLLTVHN